MENQNLENKEVETTKKSFWEKIKKPFFFSLKFLPVVVIAIAFTCIYQFDLYPPEVMEEIISVFGNKYLVLVISILQNTGMIFFCCFFGYILADKVGLLPCIKKDGKIKLFEKKKLLITLAISFAVGILFSLDYWTFGKAIPQIRESTDAGLSVWAFLASILYGGICEELMLRLFVLSLFAFIIWKIFFAKKSKLSQIANSEKTVAKIPPIVFVIANIIASLLFAAGHLPATLMTFGSITPLLLFRCFLYNGGIGYIFGWLYINYGLQYAMLSHVAVHMFSKMIWLLFV